MRKVFVVLALLGMITAPAMATSVANINPGSGSELSLYEIVNALYGPSGSIANLFGANFTSNADAALVALEFSPDQVFALTASTDLTASFAARYAAQTQEMGYYIPADGSTPSDPEMYTLITINSDVPMHTLITQDVIDNVTTSTLQGSVSNLPTAAGESVPVNMGFFNNSPNTGSQIFFSEDALNPNSLDHMITLLLDEQTNQQTHVTTQIFLLAFEDLPWLAQDGLPGDGDYNDLVVQLTVESTQPFEPVPEPASMALLGMGIVGMALRKRFMA